MNLLLLLLLGTIWGSSYLFIKVIVAEVPVFTLVAGRLTLAALAMFSFCASGVPPDPAAGGCGALTRC